MHVSERRACAALGQHRSTQRKVPRGREDAERLTADVTELARQYGRYGYRKVAALLRQAGWSVSDGRVERIWRREGHNRQEFGGLKSDQVKRLKDLELENSRLRKAVSDLTLDKLILTEAAKGNF